MKNKLKFKLEQLGFWLLRKTRNYDILLMDVVGVDKSFWDRIYDRGRITVLYDFNIIGHGREIMVGELRRYKMTHQEFLELKDKVPISKSLVDK